MKRAILALLYAAGPLSRPEIETKIAAQGYSLRSVAVRLWELKREGKIRHARRASRHRCSIYEVAP